MVQLYSSALSLEPDLTDWTDIGMSLSVPPRASGPLSEDTERQNRPDHSSASEHKTAYADVEAHPYRRRRTLWPRRAKTGRFDDNLERSDNRHPPDRTYSPRSNWGLRSDAGQTERSPKNAVQPQLDLRKGTRLSPGASRGTRFEVRNPLASRRINTAPLATNSAMPLCALGTVIGNPSDVFTQAA